MTYLFKNNVFINTFLFLITAELLSFLGYYYHFINLLGFFLIVILTILLSLRRLEYGLYILLAELFVGSFGYLFYIDLGGFKISIRMAFWLIIMSVWLAKIVMLWIKTKKLSIDFLKSVYFPYFLVLGIFIVWGLLDGFLKGNAPSNIFFDFDRWVYFALIFPVFQVLRDSHNIKVLKRIFLAAIAWLSLKTIILAYFFSHNYVNFTLSLYRWVRDSGVGEITQVQAGFSRVFIQSHIYVLIGFFIILFYLLKTLKQNYENKDTKISPLSGVKKYILLLALFLSAIIISFSRSFWLGLFAGACFVWLIALFKYKIKLKQFIIFNSIILFCVFLSLILILAALKFPYPSPYGGFDPALILGQRATQLTDEAGAASRWQLLTPLWQKIKTAPLLGRGFGATVTYKSDDPRIVASNLGGAYTTYAFEWGWLDVWLKLGLFGLLAYLTLFIKIIKDGLRIAPLDKGARLPLRGTSGQGEGDLILPSSDSYLAPSLATGLIVLMAVNIFSPYINHPLGIGYLIITACLIDFLKKPEK